MRVAVEEMDGVQEAEVSLNEGRVRVTLARDNSVTVDGLREVIRRQGFSPRDALVTASVRVERRGGELVAVVPGSGASYSVTGRAEVRPRLEELPDGATVLLGGEIAEDEDDVTPRVLRVTRVGSTRR